MSSSNMSKRFISTVTARRGAWPLRLWHVAFLTGLIGTIAFFLPLVAALEPGAARWPAFTVSADQWLAYFPSFVEGYRRFWHGGLLGLDFLTEDGASIFAYRPNLMPFYPPYLLAYLTVDCSNLAHGAIAYVVITMSHHFIGLYFTVILIRRYMALPTGASVLGAVLYSINSYTCEYIGEPMFYYQAMLVPALACALCWLARTRSRLAPVWMAPLFTSYALSNYAPMMLAGLAAAVAATLVSLAVLPDEAGRRRWTPLVGPALSLGLAALSTAPYFAAQLHYKAVMTPTVEDIDNVAHAVTLSGYDLLSAISQFLDIRRTRFEALLVWGAIPTFLAVVGLHVVIMQKGEIKRHYLSVAGAGAVVYLIMLLPNFGTSLLPAADLFYYAVPVLGKMHVYHRYLIFSQLFFAVTVAALTAISLVHATPHNRMVIAYAGVTVWLGTTMSCLLWPATGLTDTNGLMLEAFLVAVTGITVAVASTKPAFLLTAALTGIIGASSFYALPPALNRPTQWDREPDPLGPEMEDIVDFVKGHSANRALSKFVIASSDIEPYFNRNLSWLLGSRVKLMNFQGYPTHLSALADYGAAWGGYGSFDLPWLHQAGIDFVFWSDGSGEPLTSLLDSGFKLGSVLTLKGVHHVAQLLPPDPTEDPEGAGATFDNGLFRVAGPGTTVTSFETDYTRSLRLDLDVAERSTVSYLLWPNPYMQPFVDGQHVDWATSEGKPLRLDIGAGRHVVEVRFVSRAGTLFYVSQIIGMGLAALALLLQCCRNVLPRSLAHFVSRRGSV